jgi:hypothetical protein
VPERWVSIRRRTSEHWWEDEEEFDAVTDASTPKTLVLVTPPPPPPSPGATTEDTQLPAVRRFLEAVTFQAGFSGNQEHTYAQQLWAGRDKAPLFRKIRKR